MRELFDDEKHEYYSENFEFHDKMKSYNDLNASITMFHNNNIHYIIVYENVHLFDEKKTVAELRKKIDDFELCKIDIKKSKNLIFEIKIFFNKN